MAQTMDVLFPDILPYCPGVSELLVQRETRSSVIQFCREGRIFRRDLDPVSIVSGCYEYDIDVPLGTTVVEIEAITYKGDALTPKTLKEVEARTTQWREQNGTPRYYIRRPDNKFWLVPVPSATEANGVYLNVSLTPDRTATSFDDELYEEYFEPIKNLLLSRLLRIPAKDWTNIRSANAHLALYEEALTDAKIRGRKAQRGAAPTVRYGGIGRSSNLRDDYGSPRTNKLRY